MNEEIDLIKNLSIKEIERILDVLPIYLSFVDENDRLTYWNTPKNLLEGTREEFLNDYRLDRRFGALGENINDCHPDHAKPKLQRVLQDFKNDKKNEYAFWLHHPKLLNLFRAIRNESGKYLGVLNYVIDFRVIEYIAEKHKDTYVWRSHDSQQKPDGQ